MRARLTQAVAPKPLAPELRAQATPLQAGGYVAAERAAADAIWAARDPSVRAIAYYNIAARAHDRRPRDAGASCQIKHGDRRQKLYPSHTPQTGRQTLTDVYDEGATGDDA